MDKKNNIVSFYTIIQEPQKKDTIDWKVTDYTSICAITISIILLYINIKQYYNSQKWKKIEFIAEEMKSFNDDPTVKKALIMLDWNEKKLEFFPEKKNYDEQFLKFENKNIAMALNIDFGDISNPDSNFSELDSIIRDIFDTFFEKLVIINQYIEAKLFKYKDIEPYLKYWLEKIFDEKKTYKNIEVEIIENKSVKKVNLQKQIWSFLYYFGYYDVIKLSSYLDTDRNIKIEIEKYISKIRQIFKKYNIDNEHYIKNFALRTFSLVIEPKKINSTFESFSVYFKKEFSSNENKEKKKENLKIKLFEITDILKQQSLLNEAKQMELF